MSHMGNHSTEELATAVAAARTAYTDLKNVPADAKYTGLIAQKIKALNFHSEKLDRKRLTTTNKARL